MLGRGAPPRALRHGVHGVVALLARRRVHLLERRQRRGGGSGGGGGGCGSAGDVVADADRDAGALDCGVLLAETPALVRGALAQRPADLDGLPLAVPLALLLGVVEGPELRVHVEEDGDGQEAFCQVFIDGCRAVCSVGVKEELGGGGRVSEGVVG